MGQRSHTSKIPSLDGIRALSFGIVFVAHAGLERWVPGGFGVTVFFFLSGFLITTLMREEHEKAGTIDFKAFYLRRALRILPPFYLVLAAATALCAAGVLGGELQPGAVAAQFAHFANYRAVSHGYTGQALGTGVYWSLAVEEHFYLAFPLLFVVLQRLTASGRQQALVLYALCAVALGWRCWLVLGAGAAPDRTYLASDTRFDSILFGAALAVHTNPASARDAQPHPRWSLLLVPLAVAALGVSFVWRNEVFRETARYTVQGLALIPLFSAAIRFPHWLPFRLLNLKPIAALGLVSYSLYLVHHVVLFGVGRHLPGLPAPVQAVVALAISLALSVTLYFAVEKPCAALRKRLSGPPAPESTWALRASPVAERSS
ncbi:MAG: acyltransferase [Myxococcaceae bacterium]|nr:acyltransferase [Myxococcaceae bacterium]